MTSKRQHLLAFVLLLLATLAWYHPLVLNPTNILVSPTSDLIAEHIPIKRYLIKTWQETGEMPLWCPYLYSGSAVIHDPQIAAYYPLHWALLLLPEEYVGCGMSWIIVLHTFLAGWLTYVYARWRGYRLSGALIAGFGFMFAPRWMAHLLMAGHYITIGLAWMPLVLLCLEKAMRSPSILPGNDSRGALFWSLLGGGVSALLILCTQPQWTFYICIFLVLWTFSEVWHAEHLTRAQALRRWMLSGGITMIMAGALTVVQMWPTYVASRESLRAVAPPPSTLTESLNMWPKIIGPEIQAYPHLWKWESRGGFALLWLLSALLALVLCKKSRYLAGVTIILLLLSGGGAALISGLPGFSSFRFHSRILLVAAFPIALLAARTMERLFDSPMESKRKLCLGLWIGVGLLCVGTYHVTRLTLLYYDFPTEFPSYLITAPILLLVSSLLLWYRVPFSPRWKGVWIALLLLDLVVQYDHLLTATEPESKVLSSPDCVKALRGKSGRTFDAYCWAGPDEDSWLGSPMGIGVPLAPVNEIEAVRGWNPLDRRYYRRYLQAISDMDYPLVAGNCAFSDCVLLGIPLVNRQLMDLLNIRYLMLPASSSPPGENWKLIKTDAAPVAYNMAQGGMTKLVPYNVYENLQVMPRAFVVPSAKPYSVKTHLQDLKSTDFRKTVLLLDYPKSETFPGEFQKVEMKRPRAERLEMEVEREHPGFLFLSEIWYPGWKCRVNGEDVKIYRANGTFRSVKLPAGKSSVVFTFEPREVFLGRHISLIAFCLLSLSLLGLLVVPRARAHRSS